MIERNIRKCYNFIIYVAQKVCERQSEDKV